MYFRIVVFLLTLSSISCVAVSHRVLTSDRGSSLFKKESVHFIFTGFYRYEKEKQSIQQKLIEQGFTELNDSDKVVEIILQKKETEYPSDILHSVNWFLTFFSAGMFPYQIQSENTLTFRYVEKGQLLREITYNLRMDQYRGILIAPFTPFYWPNDVFRKQIHETINLETNSL
ncbi:MAG: hypothetical protein O9301_14010 [Leptospira sp.]|nr:hypothetical protein [Leptospira sp.]